MSLAEDRAREAQKQMNLAHDSNLMEWRNFHMLASVAASNLAIIEELKALRERIKYSG